LKVVPEAVPHVEEESAQPAEQGALTETAPHDHVRATSRRGTFRALGSRPFRLYFAGQVASASGTFLQQTAIGWLFLRLTGSAAELGLVLAVRIWAPKADRLSAWSPAWNRAFGRPRYERQASSNDHSRG
jgi:hypothetical protein